MPLDYDLDDLPPPAPVPAVQPAPQPAVAVADPYDLDDVPAATLERRPADFGRAALEGVQDIGRVGLALPAVGEQVSKWLLQAIGATVPDDAAPFSNTLKDMAQTDANRAQQDAQGYADPRITTAVGEGATRSLVSMAPSVALGPVAVGARATPLMVNAVTAAPGAISTAGNQLGQDLNDPNMTTGQRLARMALQGGLEFAGEMIPMGRLGRGPEEALARSLAERNGGAALRQLVLDPVAQMGQEAITGGAQSVANDLTGTQPVAAGKIATNALEQAGMSALTALPASAAMSSGAQGINALRDLQERRALDQELGQMAMQGLEPQARQMILDPATGEYFEPAMVTTPREQPLEVTPEVIDAVAQNPDLLNLYGIRGAADPQIRGREMQRQEIEATGTQAQRLEDQETEAAIEQEAELADQQASDDQVAEQFAERQAFIRRMQDGRRAARDRREADEVKDAQWRQHVAQQLRQKRTGVMERKQIPNPYTIEREQQQAAAAEAARREQIERAQVLAAEEADPTQEVPDVAGRGRTEPVAGQAVGAADVALRGEPPAARPVAGMAGRGAEAAPVRPTPPAGAPAPASPNVRPATPGASPSQASRPASVPVRSIADLDRGFREVYGLKPDESAAATALVRARASALGEDADAFAARTIAEVRQGKGTADTALMQDGTRLMPRDQSLEFDRLKRQWEKAHGRRLEPKSETWQELEQRAAEVDAERGALYQEGGDWQAFDEASGTMGVPREEMPQIRSEHRGALSNYLRARGIEWTREEATDPNALKPTQAEFSRSKVRKAKGFTGEQRAILVSKDGRILDGHHQWLAAKEAGKTLPVIRLDAPIDRLMDEVRDFPSVESDEGAGPRMLAQDRLNDAPKSPDTGKRTEKGAISFADDGRAVIHALQAPDVSTAVHELGHLFRRTLTPVEEGMAARWAGAKPKQDGTWAWGRNAEEKFARGFERYLRDGTAPNKPLQRIFAKLRDWLRSVYESIIGSPIDVKITPEIRAVFDRMLTPKDRAQVQRLEEGIRTDENRANQPAPQPAAAPAPARPVAQAEESRKKSGQSSTRERSPASGEQTTPIRERSTVSSERPTNIPETSGDRGSRPDTSRTVPDIGRTTAEQKARAADEQPSLANPGRDARMRDLVREARSKMVDPERKAQEQSIAEGKALLGEPDKVAALRKKVTAGEPLTDVETAAFSELLDRDSTEALAKGGAMLKQTIEAIQGYTRGGTEQARALAMRRDRFQTPEERRKSALTRAILMPSQAMEKNLTALRNQLEKANPTQRAAIKKRLDELTAKEVARIEKFKKRMATLGYDLDQPELLYQKDEVVAAIVDEARMDKADKWDAAYEWWMASILSGPRTNTTNILGNAGNMLATYAWEKPVQALLAKIPGLRDAGPSTGELAEVYRTLFNGQAFEFAKRHFLDTWSVERPMLDAEMESGRFLTRAQAKMLSEQGDKFSGRAPVNRGVVAKALRSVSLRAIQAVDQFFKGLAARAEVAGRAYRLAKESGYEPGSPEFREFMDQEVGDLESRSWEQAYTEAKAITFNQDPGPITQQVVRLRNATPGARYIVPFIPILVNIIGRGLKVSPITAQVNMAQRIMRHGLWSASPGARGALPYARTEFVQDLASSTLGMMALATLAGWAGDDEDGMPNLTGTEPRYIAAKEQTAPAKSIRLFGKYYSYDRLDPFASILATTADILREARSDKPEVVKAAISNLSYQALDKSFMSTVNDVAKAVGEGEVGANAAAKMLRSILVGFVPNAIRQPIGAGQDETKDQAVYARPSLASADWWQEQGRLALGSAVGGLPFVPKVDLWGNDQSKTTPTDKLGSDFLWRALAPTNSAEGKASNAYEQAIYNFNRTADKPAWPGYPRNYIQRQDGSRWYYTSETYNEMLRERGRLVMDLLDKQRANGWKLDPVNPKPVDMKRIQAVFRAANLRAQAPYRQQAMKAGALKPEEP